MVSGFEVLSKLSDGASEEVFLARLENTQERVVLEVTRPELVVDRALLNEFISITKSRKALSHASLLRRVAGGYMPDGRLFVRSEPVDDTLHTWLKQKGPLSVAELIQVGSEICQALHYLHQQGTVHGNLSPRNVFLRQGPNGLSSKLFDSHLALYRASRRLELPKNVVLVAPEYLCPERAGGQRGNILSDIYALGVLFYEALTGEPPFTSNDATLTRRKHLTDRPPLLPAHCEVLVPLVLRCLAKDPNLRFESAASVQKALMDLKESSQAGSAPLVASAKPVAAGEVVGSYRLDSLVGEGAMGQVFLASHIRLGRKVALKMLRPSLAQDRTEVQRFFHEARIVNQVSHPNIVQVHDFVDERTADGRHRVFCVMELLEGMTLRQRMEKGPLSLDELLRIGAQVTDAVDAAHKVGVLHRDLKPDNLFLTRRDGQLQVKILDFGIAKLQGQAEVPSELQLEAQEVGSTLAGTVVGTPAYMSPEQASGNPLDPRTDIYALGGVLYRSLTGKLPFVAKNFDALVNDLLNKPAPAVPDVSASGETIPADLKQWVDRCLRKLPEDRPASMAELGKGLLAIRHRLEQVQKGPRSAARTVVPKASSVRLPKWKMGAIAGATLLLPLGLGVVKLRPGSQEASGQVAQSAIAAANAAPIAAPAEVEAAPVVENKAAKIEARVSGKVAVVIRSDPSGATVERMDTGQVLGVTPLTAHWPQSTDPIPVRVSKVGRRPAHLSVDSAADFAATVRLPLD